MLKKVIAGAMLAGATGLIAAPASAGPSACVSVYLNVNAQELVNQNVCAP